MVVGGSCRLRLSFSVSFHSCPSFNFLAVALFRPTPASPSFLLVSCLFFLLLCCLRSLASTFHPRLDLVAFFGVFFRVLRGFVRMLEDLRVQARGDIAASRACREEIEEQILQLLEDACKVVVQTERKRRQGRGRGTRRSPRFVHRRRVVFAASRSFSRNSPPYRAQIETYLTLEIYRHRRREREGEGRGRTG